MAEKSLGEKRMEAALDRMSLVAAADDDEVVVASIIGGANDDVITLGRRILAWVSAMLFVLAVIGVSRFVDESGFGRISRGFLPPTTAVEVCG